MSDASRKHQLVTRFPTLDGRVKVMITRTKRHVAVITSPPRRDITVRHPIVVYTPYCERHISARTWSRLLQRVEQFVVEETLAGVESMR